MELLDQPQNKAARHKSVDLKREALRYLKLWPWIILSMVVFYTISVIYLRYTQPQFLTKTSLMLQKSKETSNTALSDLKNLGMGVSGDEELQGETTVIISKPLLKRVVQNLSLNVSVFSIGKIKEVELYHDSPLKGTILKLNDESDFSVSTFIIEVKENQNFRIIEGPNSNKTYPFNRPIKLPFGVVQLDLKPGVQVAAQFKVVFKSTSSIVNNLESAINVTLPQQKGLLMELSLVGTLPQKSEDILNELSKQYNIEGVNDKNLEAQNTQNFINDRLEIITADLDGVEGQKEGFKRQNQITDIDAQATLALTNSNDDTRQLMNLSTQMDLVNSISKIVNTDKLLPSNMGLSAATEGYISQYNELLLTRNRTQKQATSLNPALIELNKQIGDLRTVIKSNLEESKQSFQVQIGRLQGRLVSDKRTIDQYPTQEKVFRSIERQRTLKEQLYLYLLQKREENAITLAVTAPKSKVVNPAFSVGPVSPKTSQIKSGALALGAGLPIAIFALLSLLDNKIRTKQQILSNLPDVMVLAEIPKSDDNTEVQHNDFSVFAESFRILTSNLKYLFKGKIEGKGGVILITSSIKGEGKTTIASNTAITLAGGSKTLLIGGDIRNPQLQHIFIAPKEGLTDFLVSENQDPKDYIVNSKKFENLDVLFSGHIAPNPNDLLDMEKMDLMVQNLRQYYDYIVIDSAPIMLVSDTMHLIELSDVLLYVVKSDYTDKAMLNFANEFKTNNQIKNMAFVLNSVKMENTSFNYKYGYGYYSTEKGKKRNFWKK